MITGFCVIVCDPEVYQWNTKTIDTHRNESAIEKQMKIKRFLKQ